MWRGKNVSSSAIQARRRQTKRLREIDGLSEHPLKRLCFGVLRDRGAAVDPDDCANRRIGARDPIRV